MLSFFLTFVFFLASRGQSCSSDQVTCISNAGPCTSNYYNNQTALCQCYQSNLASCGGSTHCDGLATQVAAQCGAEIIAGGLLTQAQTVFSTGASGCNYCTNPYGSANWPSSCTTSVVTYSTCFVANVPTFLGGASTNGTQPIAAACTCMNTFVSSLSRCGIPGFNPATYKVYCDAYPYINELCVCGGSTSLINPNNTAVIAYVKTTLAADFQNWIMNHGSITGTLQAAFDTARSYVCQDRLLLNIASGSYSLATIQSAINSYFGTSGRFTVITGNLDVVGCPTSTTTSGKRNDEQGTQFTVVASAHQSVVGLFAILLTVVVSILML